MKKAFDIINTTEIKSYYFYASRRSVIVPSLCFCKNVEDIFDKIAFKKRITIKSFMKKVGLDGYDYDVTLNKYHLKEDVEYGLDEIKKNDSFLNEIFPIIKENSKKELKNFQKYVKNMQFSENVAIVDIGWYGTMQKALELICPNTTINGFYMALVPGSGYYDDNEYQGYIADKNHDTKLYNKLHYFISLFEFFFLAQHGSVRRFVDNETFVELYDYEYEEKPEREFAKNIQNGAIDYIVRNKGKLKINKNEGISNLYKKLLNPKNIDAIMFGNISFVDDNTRYVAKPRSLFYYLLHPKTFVKDFKDSSWRIGFLKRIFKIWLPYYRINNLLRKMFVKNEVE